MTKDKDDKCFKFHHKLWEKYQKAFDFPFPTLFYSRFQDGVKYIMFFKYDWIMI